MAFLSVLHGVLLLALMSSWPRGSQEAVGLPGIQAIVTRKGMDYCEYECIIMRGEGGEEGGREGPPKCHLIEQVRLYWAHVFQLSKYTWLLVFPPNS